MSELHCYPCERCGESMAWLTHEPKYPCYECIIKELNELRAIKSAAENLIKTHHGDTDISLSRAIGMLETALDTKGGVE